MTGREKTTRAFKLMYNDADYKAYMTYLNNALEIQSMIYTTNWIECLNRDFRRVTRMRTAIPNEESVLASWAVSPWNTRLLTG